MQERNFLQRYGGHLMLLAVGVVLFLGLRLGDWGRLLSFDLEAPAETATAVSPDATEVANSPAATAEPEVDIASLPVLQDNSLVPVLDPFTFEAQRPEHTNLISYTVQRNDTPNGIAELFGIEPETLLGCNPRLSEESSLLQTDDVIVICPVDGVLHDVGQNDTLESLSQRYGIPVEDIIAYEPNNLTFPYRLFPGSQIFVPGAVREVFVWTAPTYVSSGSSSGGSSGGGFANLGTGTYIWPVTSRRITQYYWYSHQAIDIGIPEGTAVYASDSGTVSYAAWNNSGYGYLIVINHGNGYETYYAHLSGFNVYVGQQVTQGALIGYSGNTGRSSGPHLHFEIRLGGFERVNPLWAGYLP
ncbi:MAG: peptidoglycan DD-metalloendopeptidase family protein [Anaerolineales bacterium]|nr:peptidoglycan DD-metalloendopeptidase family protein [Anaerolineales bacterium]